MDLQKIKVLKLLKHLNVNNLIIGFIIYFFFFFLWCLGDWLPAQLKEIWKIKGIVDEPDTYEHDYVELSDDEQGTTKPTSSCHSNTSENTNDDEDEDESCDSDTSEVCGTIASNKFSALEMSD